MKKLVLLAGFIMASLSQLYAQEFKIITIVESIVPGGLGRSRIIENQGTVNLDALTSERDGKKATATEASRADAKESGENAKETKLLNFYSLAGINFGNIAANDAIIAAKINEMISQCYTVAYVTSGVESVGSKDDANGIFITRIFFVKNKK